jgi:hypothetical protein
MFGAWCRLILLPDFLQTSCAWVLKESRSVYKTASEGIMNLADKFFEMERAQALQVRMLRQKVHSANESIIQSCDSRRYIEIISKNSPPPHCQLQLQHLLAVICMEAAAGSTCRCHQTWAFKLHHGRFMGLNCCLHCSAP